MNAQNVANYLDYYDLEQYLFTSVRPRFLERRSLSAFDFFCIVIWKANRAKTLVARRLLSRGHGNLESAVAELTGGVARQCSAEDRLRYLWQNETWGIALPMASAILTVLYPEEFTVYDIRVCNILGDFHKLGSVTRSFDDLWRGYQEFRSAVIETGPACLSLRNKDRYLWGKSFAEQLRADIGTGFVRGSSED